MEQRLVVVSAGTYHLPFDRLSEWMQRWMQDRTDIRMIVQHGPSVSVRGAENVDILPYAQLLSLCAKADAVVLQGGAGGIMDMRMLGVVPIVVPRVPGGGEVVDDHQLVFTAEMAKLGIIKRASSFEALAAHLDAAMTGSHAAEPPAVVPAPGAGRVAQLFGRPLRKLPWPYRIRRLLRSAAAIVRERLTRSDR